MSQWKSILVVALFLVGLTPTATSQAAVAYSIAFTEGQIHLDVKNNVNFFSYVEIQDTNRWEFDHILKDGETFSYTNNTGITDNLQILSLTVRVQWEATNWTDGDFIINALGLSETVSSQNGSIGLTWYGHNNLTYILNHTSHLVVAEANNESDFESSFFLEAPSNDMSFAFNEKFVGNLTEINYSVRTEIITWEFDVIHSDPTVCTEMVITNEGQATVDVDVSLSGGGITISPGAVSVTLAPGGSITVPFCVIYLGSSYKTVQVSAIASGRESNTQLNQVNKNAGFAVIVSQYMLYSVYSSPSNDICLGNTSQVEFTAVNNGNYQDTVKVRISNLQDLEDAGFMLALPAVQYQIDSAGEQPVRVLVDSSGVSNTEIDYPLTLNVSTTLQGDDTSAENTTIMKFVECQDSGEGDGNETVFPGKPTAIAGQDVSISPGDTVQFNGAGTDEDGTIVKYEWDFDGDGVYEWSSEENGRTTNIYNNPGTYTPTLRVTDNDGKFATDSLTVTVKSPGENDESGLPSLSLLAVVTLLGIISVLRRR